MRQKTFATDGKDVHPGSHPHSSPTLRPLGIQRRANVQPVHLPQWSFWDLKVSACPRNSPRFSCWSERQLIKRSWRKWLKFAMFTHTQWTDLPKLLVFYASLDVHHTEFKKLTKLNKSKFIRQGEKMRRATICFLKSFCSLLSKILSALNAVSYWIFTRSKKVDIFLQASGEEIAIKQLWNCNVIEKVLNSTST